MKISILSLFCLVGSIVGAARLGLPLVLGFAFGCFCVVLLAIKKGMTLKQGMSASLFGLRNIKPVFLILILIALLIPSWILSGTIPTMIYYFSSWIQPEWMVLFAFLLTAITSFLLGTSIGTLGSLGIIILGVAISVEAPIPLVAGALVSGAFFGDRGSPLSAMVQLTATTVEIETKQILKNMWPSTLILFLGCCAIYFILSMNVELGEGSAGNEIIAQLESVYNLHLLTLFPVIILFGSILLKVSTIRALTFGVIASLAVALLLQHVHLNTMIHSLIFGYEATHTDLKRILQGGGILSMTELFIFVSLAGMLNGILNQSKMFEPIIQKIFHKVSSLTNYSLRTVLFAISMAVAGCNQAFPVIFTGSSVRSRWKQAGFQEQDLGRVLCDSAVVTSGVIPWNMVAILSAAAIGVATVDYAPYAVLLWLAPIVTVLTSTYYTFIRERMNKGGINHDQS